VRAALLGLASLAFLAGCSTDVPGCGTPRDAAGTWSYTGNQVSPTASLSGTLTLAKTGTCTLSGTLSLTIDQGGAISSYGWPTTAHFLDDSVIEIFADSLAGAQRYHLGFVQADSIMGDWNKTESAAYGSFKAIRSAP
jgi:hypothetical protein